MAQRASLLSRPALLASVRGHAGLRAVQVSPPRLRTANGHHRDGRSASWVELFFDLVFAGAVGQLAGALQDHPALGELARFAVLFTPIWWLWVMFTFYADR
ncbi:MAG TPA: low temperature requirement protein A, partial [Streptosporangiaceae bacterium]|nr:low temperature requirement protein A [Streptosporangiaceae bacterium]